MVRRVRLASLLLATTSLALLPPGRSGAQPIVAPVSPPGVAAPAVSAPASPVPPTPPVIAAPAPPASGTPLAAEVRTVAPGALVMPPVRVGRVAALRGTVSFHAPSDAAWRVALANLPVTDGDALWTEPGAFAALQVSASTVALAPSTELDVTALDGRSLAASEGLGEAYIHLVALAPGEVWTLATPRGSVQLLQDGRYAVRAGDTLDPTVVTVIEGRAVVTGAAVAVTVATGQAATLTGTDTIQASLGAATRDGFVQAMLAEEARVVSAALPDPVLRMTGCESLAQYGTWASAPQYGAVWYPRVATGWVPYREGRWSWVEPWGWTWVDDSAWGFTPFHYGRWAELSGRWGWLPLAPGVLPAAEPVYAPALVSFATFAGGAALGFAAAELAGHGTEAPGRDDGRGGVVGWVPLGPREPYLPAFRASPRYVEQVNVTSVNDTVLVRQAMVGAERLGNDTRLQPGGAGIAAGRGGLQLADRAGATMMPAGAMALSQPVAQLARPLPASALAAFGDRSDARAGLGGRAADGGLVGERLAPGAPPVVPVAATPGLAPATARALGVAVPAAGLASLHQVAPGPSLGSAAQRPGGRPVLAQAVAGEPHPPAATPAAPRVPGHGSATGVQDAPAAAVPGAAAGAMHPGEAGPRAAGAGEARAGLPPGPVALPARAPAGTGAQPPAAERRAAGSPRPQAAAPRGLEPQPQHAPPPHGPAPRSEPRPPAPPRPPQPERPMRQGDVRPVGRPQPAPPARPQPPRPADHGRPPEPDHGRR